MATVAANPQAQCVGEPIGGQATSRIEELQNHGINAADVGKLKLGGIFSIEALQMATKKEILSIRGITEAKYSSLLSAASQISGRTAGRFKTASEVREEMSSRFKISTGAKEFDSILGGGIESGALTEVYGEFRTGKSQLCMTIAVLAQLHETNPGKVFYIDTEGSFRPNRLSPVCERFGVDFETVLDNIICARLFTTDQQEELPLLLEAKISEEETAFALIIIDSVMNLWRSDFSGRGELSDRQQRLGRHLNLLKKVAERHNIAILYTNLVMSDPSGGITFVADPKKAVGGHVISHASTTRVMLRKGRDNERIAKIIDSPTMPESEARFIITDSGITDSI